MMNNIKTLFLLLPRQSGKTTMAIYEYLKDPLNTIFITHNARWAEEIRTRLEGSKDRVMSSSQYINRMNHPLRRIITKRIILDEYMFFPDKDELYRVISQQPIESLFIYSTSDKVYSREIYDYVKANKHQTLDYILNNFKPRFGVDRKRIIQEIYDLYYNFLTDTDIHLIDNVFEPLVDKSKMFDIMSRREYDLEILNMYLDEHIKT